MDQNMRSLVLLLLLTLLSTLAHGAAAQPSSPGGVTAPAPPLPTAAREFLQAHNQARAELGVIPLKWSETLANATRKLVRSQRDKMGCQFANLTSSKFGGNQLLFGGGAAMTPRMVVDFWVEEKKYYNYTDNSCAANKQCGVYTQVVWRKSLELGCAQATCVKEAASLTVCFYNPPGNIVGEKPY